MEGKRTREEITADLRKTSNEIVDLYRNTPVNEKAEKILRETQDRLYKERNDLDNSTPDPKPYKTEEVSTRKIWPGDRINVELRDYEEKRMVTVKTVTHSTEGTIINTAKGASIFFKKGERVTREVTPADEAEKQDRIVKEQTAEFLEAAAKLEDCQCNIVTLQQTIQEHAEKIMNAVGKHHDDLLSLHEALIEPEDLDASQFYQDLEEEIGEALNHAKEMNQASRELAIEIKEKEIYEDFLNEDK